ncbi:transglutaminase-like cysteine peptidase [Mesorhizobium sp. CA18]|uniref:transglutaminase-like cysteine peptidase n=1 Tax=unclassified Mesorhizobium TaxID=325217 RepID=UPI001CCB84F6|nr:MULTISPECIES: transglutaminase-like cysteine peptidase [unclassified Mesorhizobium]MBZ9733243.1 transglutaminase-like cysteine peptidase [Mesorhizobium sp. CA9]MBZ9825969.1 transglutaminase-like cysteine peptidase [Mesorhizobium sp. CA18]MBZ9831078.1 transglutaminase-like cysteine peptidase [Mesorhizobium sp. CA2]MBZ9835247.1 transglutaminase-like cysteine peptidase [Mesorhizobium sp. CA3]MBZ9845887.1 transglutaminase-like cysteine peptidase [Mesorhizobium sp. CA5]
MQRSPGVLTSSFLIGLVSLVGASSLQVGPAAAQSSLFKLTAASSAAVGGSTSVPYGWLDFCRRRPKECKVPALPATSVRLTAQNMGILKRVNQKANHSIKPVSNYDHWGTMMDHWDYPTDGKGDCKIYALYKRKLLLEAGFPRQALLMTVVRDLHNEGHTILTVKTDKGDLVLDNLVDEIRPWNATGYYFLKRQSQQNPNTWVSINQRGGTAKRLSPSS